MSARFQKNNYMLDLCGAPEVCSPESVLSLWGAGCVLCIHVSLKVALDRKQNSGCLHAGTSIPGGVGALMPMRVQKSFLKRRTSYGGATHLHQSGKVKALQPAGPIYQQGPGSNVPFWACCSIIHGMCFFFFFCAFILLCSFLFLDPAQHNTIHLPQHGSYLSDAYKFSGPMRAQWALSHAGVTVATSHLNFTLRCLDAEQQMCLLAICSGVCHDGGFAAAPASCRIQAGWRY